MAKKVRFPLQMNGTDVRTIEELREHFDLESVLGYFTNGKLVTWLKDRYYDNEAMSIEALSADDAELNRKIMSALGISVDTEAEDIDIEAVQRRNEKLMLLRQFTDDKEIIKNVDCVAFNQDDLLDILDEGAEKIYLCQGEFDIPLTVKNVTYIGLKNPIVLLRAYDNVNFKSLNIKLVDICFGWDISSTTGADRLYQAERMMERQEFDRAIPILEQLVAEDNPRAYNMLSQMYEHIYPSQENKNKLLSVNERGADLGDVFSWIETGKDFPVMKKLLHKLVKKGNGTAMGYLGYLYFNDGDFENSIKYFEMGAKENEIMCCDNLFYIYKEDYNTVPENIRSNEKAIYYGRKGALLGSVELAKKMAGIYLMGEIVAEDYKKTVEFYKIAAEHGDSYAQRMLGWAYDTAKGVEKDLEKAVYWFEKGIVTEEEDLDVDTLFELGYLYEKGLGTTQNYKRAFKLYEKAAKAEKPNINAQNNLGYLYDHGYGVTMDKNLALFWYEKAAASGNETARTNAEVLRNEMRTNVDSSPADDLRARQKRMGDELRDEISSITDDLRNSGFFNIMG